MSIGLGIDVGSQWIKVVQVKTTKHFITVTGALKIPNPVTSAATTEGGAASVPETLGEDMAKAGLRRKGTVGITGREVMLKYLTTPPLPPEKLMMMVDMQVGGNLLGSRKIAGSDDGPPVTYDFRILNTPSEGLQSDLVIMAGLAKNEYLGQAFDKLSAAKVTANRCTPSAFGLVQAYLRTQKVNPEETVVLVDVGHEMLELAILQNENLYFARSAPGGGKKFEQELDKLLRQGMDSARAFKEERAKLAPEGAKLADKQELQIQSALRQGADGIAGAIRSALMFARTQGKIKKLDYQRVFLSGGGARLRGLRDYLEQKTKRPVQVLDLYTGLDLRKLDAASARCFEGEIPDMAVALGLAVIDADPKCFHFNLVPAPLVKKREFWGKTVYAAAAGVVLMGGLYLPMVNAGKALNEAKAEKEKFDGYVTQAKGLRRKFNEQRANNKALAKKVDYYARQARLGQVYLNVFAQLRAETPRGMTLTYTGPTDNRPAGNSAPANLSDNLYTEALQLLQVNGYYDKAVVKDIHATTEAFFRSLKQVPGVESCTLDAYYDDAALQLAPGLKGFLFTIRLSSPYKPIVATEDGGLMPPAPAGKPKGAEGPKATNKKTAAR